MTKPLLSSLLFSLVFCVLIAALVACAPVAQVPADVVQDAAPATPVTPAEARAEAVEEAREEALDDEDSLEALLRRHAVVYEVEARQGPERIPCSADVTLRDGDETRQFTGVAADGATWRYGMGAEPGTLLYLSAQTNCGGEVIARLYLDGELFRQASNGGRFAVARVRRVY